MKVRKLKPQVDLKKYVPSLGDCLFVAVGALLLWVEPARDIVSGALGFGLDVAGGWLIVGALAVVYVFRGRGA